MGAFAVGLAASRGGGGVKMRVLGASTGDMVASRGEVSQKPPPLYYSKHEKHNKYN